MFTCALLSLKALSYHDTQNQVTLAGKTAGSPLGIMIAGVEVVQFSPQALLDFGGHDMTKLLDLEART